MNRNSLVNAFRVLRNKPFVLLLLLPMQAITPLITKFMPDTSANMGIESLDSTYGDLWMILILLGAALVLGLINSLLLMPPAMELLRDGAAGRETPSGWYVRGLKKHWWKPITLGAIKAAIDVIFMIAFYILLIVFGIFGGVMIGAAQGASLSSPDSMVTSIVLLMLIPAIPFAILMLAITSCFALLLPAAADRGFGAAFKTVFSKRGLKKVMKLIGVQLLIGLIGLLIFAAFGAGYLFLSGGWPDSLENAAKAINSFQSSWTGYFAMLLVSAFGIYSFSYAFCLFQEIINAEDKETQSLPDDRISRLILDGNNP